MKKIKVVAIVVLGGLVLGSSIHVASLSKRLSKAEEIINNQGQTLIYVLQTPEISSVISKRIEREKTQK